MKTFKAGIIGTGYIGPAHIEALRRLGDVEVVALAEVGQTLADEKAEKLVIPRAYGDYRQLLNDADIDVVHNCTPNHLHFQINGEILSAGKHVVSEKPLAVSSFESRQMVQLAQRTRRVNAVNFNYRYYPLVQHVAAMVRNKVLGRVFAVRGCYLQDWLLFDTDWNWRLEPKYAGASRAIADIGSHWFDLIRFVTGKKIIRLFADLFTLHEYRKRPKVQVDTFAGKVSKPARYQKKKITTEDQGHVLMEFDDGARGTVAISQVAAGRKNHVFFELCGTKKSVWWDQERPNELVIGQRNEPNVLLLKDPLLMDESVRDYAHYPAGHNEGYPSCVMNFCRNVYRHVKNPRGQIDYTTFVDGHNAIAVVEAIMRSHQTQRWTPVRY
jgi:predicted dehydrogenase